MDGAAAPDLPRENGNRAGAPARPASRRAAATFPAPAQGHSWQVLGFIIALVVGGLIVGALARLALPGPDPMPIWATILLGIGGMIVGGIIVGALTGHGAGIVGGILGAMLLLYLYRRFVQHRPLWGPGANVPRR